MYSVNFFSPLRIMKMFETNSPGVCEQTSRAPFFNRSAISLSFAAVSPSYKFFNFLREEESGFEMEFAEILLNNRLH